MKVEPLLVEKPWGGSWLAKQYGTSQLNIGEAWLLSTLKDGESRIDGKRLSDYLGGSLSFVVKIIDAVDHLSVQVHPQKTECWLVLDARPESGVYLGLRDGVSGADFFEKISSGESVEQLIQFVPVKRGDFITVPAGLVHAIGAGVTLLEVQQASGLTYRLWDWGRPGRDLHIEKAKGVASFDLSYTMKRNILQSKAGLLLFRQEGDFVCYFNQANGEGWFIDLDSYEVYQATQAHSDIYLFVQADKTRLTSR